MIVQEDVPYTKEEVKAMVKTIHYLREQLKQLGWHPTSEPPVIPEGHCGIEVLALLDTPSGTFQPYKMFYTESGWKYESVKWWCYPPNEE